MSQPPDHVTEIFPFPIGGERHLLSLCEWSDWSWGEPLRATVRHAIFEEDGSIRGMREAEVVLLHPHHLSDVPWSTVQEAIGGWAARFAAMSAEEAEETDFFELMPWAAEDAAALGGRYAEWLATHLPEPPDEAAQRREGALAAAEADFPRLAAHVFAVWGFKLSRTVIAFDAFFRAIAGWPVEVTEIAGVRPGGIFDRLAPGGWARVPAVDERVHGRFRRDPPEFLMFGWGDSDGQHFGLWYDEHGAAAGVVHNYARDSAETWYVGRTALAVLRSRWEYDPPVDDESGFPARRFLEELDWFEEHDPAPMLPPWRRGEELVGGPAAVPAGPSLVSNEALSRPAVDEAIVAAMDALSAGDPTAALSLGRELWWMDDDATRDDALALLVGAYVMLGRIPHAVIASTHAKHRDRRTVDAFAQLD